MSFELFVARRYLLARRKGVFAWVTSLIGVAGVAVGVAALVTTLSVMNGFQKDIRSKIVGAQAHVVVRGAMGAAEARELAGRLESGEGVVAAAPFAMGQAILHVGRRTTGAVVKGLDPAREFSTNELKGALKRGDWADLVEKDGKPGLVLGVELARSLGAWPGQDAVLLSPHGASTALGVLPRMRAFRIVGLLETGYYEYDSSMAYASLEAVGRFFGDGAAYGAQLRLGSMDEAEGAAARLREELGFDHVVHTFKDLNRTLFAALKLEKFVMFTILALIVLVASFNIASNLILLTNEKVRDIGLLKAMGAGPAAVRRIFLLEGALIAGVGVGLGLALGLSLSWAIGRFPIVELPSDIYYLSRVPVSVEPLDVLAVAGASLLLCLFGTLYPAARAARVDPVEAIHYG